MSRTRLLMAGMLAVAMAGPVSLVADPERGHVALAEGVGRASWTPSESATTPEPSRFLLRDDSITYRTDASWDQGQINGLARYANDGLRYTHEVNDRSGRLHATGYWATNHPDPAYDRDDDDEDGRWEEAEITVGRGLVPGRTYTTMVQFTRWHPKRQHGSCEWAWDRRLGGVEVLSQLSRDLLGEWQAERYTLAYGTSSYPRVGSRPDLPSGAPRARCHEARPGDGQDGFVVTFARPLSWNAFLALPGAGRTRWTAFEAVGTADGDDRAWTCGGPTIRELGLRPCRDMGVDVDGVVAAVGYFDRDAAAMLRASTDVADVGQLRDTLTGLLFDVGGFGIQLPGLTVNDRYWELFLTE